MAQNQATFTVEDYDGERSTMQLNIGPLTATNFTAVRAGIDAVKVALPALIGGEVRKTTISEQFSESAAVITDQDAQRETKWLVTYRDITQFLDVANTINNVGFGNLYTVEIPTADLSLLSGNQDQLDLTAPTVAPFVTAFEAIQNSPTGGNETNIVSIKHVGRRS